MNENTPVADVLDATIKLYTKSKKNVGSNALYNDENDSFCVLGAITAVVTNKEELETNQRAARLAHPTKRFKNLKLIRKTARFLWQFLKEEAAKTSPIRALAWGDTFAWYRIYNWNDHLIGGNYDSVTGKYLGPVGDKGRRRRFLELLRAAQREAKRQGV